MAVYFEKLELLLEKKLQESQHQEINIGGLIVTIECETNSKNICNPLLCVERILGRSSTLIK